MYTSTGRTGSHTDSKRFIPVHKLFDMLSKDQLNGMLSLHCLSGCDTTSSLYGKGEKVLKLLMQDSPKYQPFKDMCEEASLHPIQKYACGTCITDLYSSRHDL